MAAPQVGGKYVVSDQGGMKQGGFPRWGYYAVGGLLGLGALLFMRGKGTSSAANPAGTFVGTPGGYGDPAPGRLDQNSAGGAGGNGLGPNQSTPYAGWSGPTIASPTNNPNMPWPYNAPPGASPLAIQQGETQTAWRARVNAFIASGAPIPLPMGTGTVTHGDGSVSTYPDANLTQAEYNARYGIH